ncbi:MAG TPA: rhomboid family intramembrane serine protease, partial [Bacteroidia bacterium]|nr:rhomboid family intramembrane serine protease [Bacteroidia bacterium]
MNPEQKTILKSFIPPFIFVAVLWIVKFTEIIFETSFADYGVFPRHTEGLIGIVTAPLIHADFEHLISNSIPLLILGATLFYFYRELALKVFVLSYLLSGFWLWIMGRENYHIGASGVLYGLVTFLFFSGVLRKHTGLMALSLLVVFLYGGLIWGIFPLFKVISWESHLCGSLAGILLAFVYRKE